MVAIKGIEMPCTCRACELNRYDQGGRWLCEVLGVYIEDLDFRDSRCPLIEVPQEVDHAQR